MKNTLVLTISILLFTYTSHSQIMWQQEGSDLSGDESGDKFGRSVSLSSNGSAVAIGSLYGSGSGLIRIYENLTGTWVQRGDDIYGEGLGGIIGFSVSINKNGTMVAFGAPITSGSDTLCGAVKVYHYVSNHWIQLGNTIIGTNAYDYCGREVSLSSEENIVAVSSYQNDENGTSAGQVRVFKYESGSWIQLGNSILGDTIDDYCGYSISLNRNGTFLAVGLPHDNSPFQRAGRVRLYQYNNSDWVQVGPDIVGTSVLDGIGSSVSISADGQTVALSAFSYSSHVDVYKYISGSWVQMGNSIVQDSLDFGNSNLVVSLSADATTLAVGNPMCGLNGLNNSGQTKVYQYFSGNWTQIGNEINGDSTNMYFGTKISLSSDGTHLAVCSSSFGPGIARVYRLSQVSIPDLSKQKSVFLFPNPTSEKLFIKTDNDFIGAAFFISDSNGKIILKGTILNENSELSIDKFPSGIYCFRAIGKREISLKFVVY